VGLTVSAVVLRSNQDHPERESLSIDRFAVATASRGNKSERNENQENAGNLRFAHSLPLLF
jgi:hypothetical protein